MLALAWAGAVLLLVWSLAGKQSSVETVAPSDAWSPSLPVDVPGWVSNLLSGVVTEPVKKSVSEVTPSFDVEALRDQIEEIADGHAGVYGVAVLDPTSGTKVSLRGDEQFMAASIGKLPAFVTLYRAAARGDLDLQEEISIREDDVQAYGSGSLQNFPVGYSLSLRDSAYRLVNHSDNTAWAMLDRRLGEKKIRAELEGMGVTNSQYFGYLSGYYTTPDDVLLLLERISDPQFTSEELSNEMLDAMTETVFEDRIPEKLPRDVRVAHKIGSYGEYFGDAGVLFYTDDQGVEKRYYLVVLSKGVGEYEARDAMQDISVAVYEALTGNKVDREWSRGKDAQLESEATNALLLTQPSSANITQTPTKENAEPTTPSLDENPSPKSWNGLSTEESWRYAGNAERQPAKSLPQEKTSPQSKYSNVYPSSSTTEPTPYLDPYTWEYAGSQTYSGSYTPASTKKGTVSQ